MHLLLNNYSRILYSDNDVFSEYSDAMRTWGADTMGAVLTLDEDYIYISAPHTFASRFFLMDGANVNSIGAQLTVEYYYGSNKSPSWRSVKNLRDETKVGTAPFGKSGFISWDLPTDWVRTQVNGLPELPYNQAAIDGFGDYWIRIKSSQTLTAGTALKWLGLIWTTQDYIKVFWPEVDSAQFLPTGQDDWYELIEMSTGDVADDLNIANIIDYELQAKDIDEMAKLTALKTAINILIPMTSSDTLKEMKSEWTKKYKNLLQKRLKGIDKNKNEVLDESEKKPLTNTRMQRY